MSQPQLYEVYEHRDGGSLYVVGRTPHMVCIQRRPYGDSQAEPQWIRITSFTQMIADDKPLRCEKPGGSW